MSDGSPVFRAVTLRWLSSFSREHRDDVCSWKVAKEYLAPAHGGGAAQPLVVTSDTLDAHRKHRARAEAEKTGEAVEVHYVDVRFDELYTTDIVECFVRYVLIKHSYHLVYR